MNMDSTALRRARKTALWGQWMTGLMVCVITLAVIAFLTMLMLGHEVALNELSQSLDWEQALPLPGALRALLIGILWMTPDLIGLAVALLAYALFRNIRKGGFFTGPTAVYLRRIGWCILAITPVQFVTNAAALALYSFWAQPENGALVFSIDDTDFYTVMLGLIVLTTGHLMVQAVELSTENESFV